MRINQCTSTTHPPIGKKYRTNVPMELFTLGWMTQKKKENYQMDFTQDATNMKKFIIPGWIVEFIDIRSVLVKENGKDVWKTEKFPIYGMWTGKKVECWDKAKTTVRSSKWIRPLSLLEIIRRIKIDFSFKLKIYFK